MLYNSAFMVNFRYLQNRSPAWFAQELHHRPSTIYRLIYIYIYVKTKYNVGCLYTEQHVDVLPSKNQVLCVNNIIIMLKYCICN